MSLVKLSSPMPVFGSTTGFKSSMYTYTSESLDEKYVDIHGYGPDGMVPYGTLHYGTVIADSFPDQYNIRYRTTPAGQSAAGGDSGGPAFIYTNGTPFQVGTCKNGLDYSRPENFEHWVFGYIYNSPVPLPTMDTAGRGQWFLYPPEMGSSAGCVPPCSSPDPQFWTNPLPTNTTRSTWNFDPCPGQPSGNYYRYTIDYSMVGWDAVQVITDYNTQTFTGAHNYWAWGRGNMRIAYSTYGTSGSRVNRMGVQCCYSTSDYTCNTHAYLAAN